MNVSAPSERLDYLDAVRAFALLLGVVFHASLSFVPSFIGWAVMDVSTSEWVPDFARVSHSFRMPLFFLIAGYFSRMSHSRYGAQRFIRTRVTRIALPFIVGWFILYPLLVSIWIIGAQSMRGDVQVASALLAGFAMLAELPAGLLTRTHLWFLYYLLLATSIVVGVSHLARCHPRIRARASRAAKCAAAWLARSRLAVLALAIPTAGCISAMQHWGIDTPDKSLVPHWPVLLLYTGCFGVGWLLQRRQRHVEDFAQLSASTVVGCAILIVAVTVLAKLEGDQALPHYRLVEMVFAFGYGLMMWTLIIITIGTFRRILSRRQAMVRYLADASYWIYLVHLPVVVALQIAVAEWPLHWTMKFTAVSLATVLICVLTYDAIARSTWLGVLLSGKRRPRALFRNPRTSRDNKPTLSAPLDRRREPESPR